MTGGRRPSGEVINATLMEIFLSFVFVVLTVAWFRTNELEQYRNRNGAATRRIGLLGDSLNSARAGVAELSDSLASARAERDAIMALYRSQFPPFCEKRVAFAVHPQSASNLSVTMNLSMYGFRQGQVITVSAEQFEQRFSSFRDYGLQNKCRYRVLLYDSPNLGKKEWQRLWRIVRTSYYVGERAR